MSKLMVVLFTLAVLVFVENVVAIGESAVITLVFPGGARSDAMGEIGTALADDEFTTFWNPAGLGLENERFHGGAIGFFNEEILPLFDIGLQHYTGSVVYQQQKHFHGGFGVNYNFIDMGVNTWNLEDSNDTSFYQSNSYEAVYTLSYGNSLKTIGLENHYLGISAKYIDSHLAPGVGGKANGIAKGVAFDIGYLWQFNSYCRFGLTLQNMGPSVYYVEPDQRDPLPFTINTALAYSQKFSHNSLRLLDINGELRLEREIVKAYPNKNPDPFYKAFYTDFADKSLKRSINEIVLHSGGEITLFNTASLRVGRLFDKIGVRNEFHYGFGIKLLNHLQLDWYEIDAPESETVNGARHNQWGVSASLFRVLNFDKSDLQWYKTDAR